MLARGVALLLFAILKRRRFAAAMKWAATRRTSFCRSGVEKNARLPSKFINTYIKEDSAIAICPSGIRQESGFKYRLPHDGCMKIM